MIKKVCFSFLGVWVSLSTFLPGLAWAGKKGAIIWVADTRELTGLLRWFAAMYNEAIATHALWVIIITACVGVIFGFGMDMIMKHTGLELEKRELRE